MRPVSGLLLLPFSIVLFFTSESSGQEAVVRYNVLEEQDAFTLVGNVARDSLLYRNMTNQFQRMKFQILVQGNQYASLFTIDESASTLQTRSVLDRETICPDDSTCLLTFNVAVYLKDNVTEVLDLFRLIEIIINLEDINDNSPQFPNDEITIPISENSAVKAEYFTHGAIDKDTGANNSVQSYKMEPDNEMFGLNVLHNPDGTSDLNIVVNYPLDRESRSFYQLVIYALDGGFPVRTGSVKVNITITDQNDNAPVFSEQEYNVTVEENSPRFSTILLVTATDTDFGDNGLVRYQFNTRTSSKVTDLFSINGTTGEITCKSVLDYEDFTNKWAFKIEAYDNGNPPRTTTVSVTINIADINDNYPQININLPPGGTKISEAADTGSFVAHVAVFDLDAGVNGEVKCKVLGQDFLLEDFKIKDNYKVVLNKPLNYESTDKYEVSIQCEDGGNPPKMNSTSFSVIVEDINDNFPEFTPSLYKLTVQEEVLQTTYIQVTAKDADSGENGHVTYGLPSNAPEGFYINSNSGLITVNKKFDHEEEPSIRFYVLARDKGEPALTSTATVVINITDINDNPPLFPSDPVELHVTESEQPHSIMLGVNDPDFGLNGEFILTFPQNDYLKEYFSFNSTTGEIITLRSIDREEIPYFKFRVTAVDRGIPQRSSSAEVIILIDDINDNIPAITYPNNSNKTKHVVMTVPVGFVVATVEASDKDDGLNSQLLYFIDSGDTRELFKMDVNTGQITIAREMTEQDVDKYELEIAVRDNGKDQRTSYADMIVYIDPSNDTSLLGHDEEQKQNLTIVGIFVGITVILSIAIIVTIFIIRHIDKRNRRRPASKVTENKYYETARPDESMSASSNLSRDSDAELLKKRAKKEVSFSIDEDSDAGNNSTLTNVTSFTTTKTLPSYLSMDYKPNVSTCISFINNKAIDWSKTKAFANDKIIAGGKMNSIWGRVENFVRKGENGGYQGFKKKIRKYCWKLRNAGNQHFLLVQHGFILQQKTQVSISGVTLSFSLVIVKKETPISLPLLQKIFKKELTL